MGGTCTSENGDVHKFALSYHDFFRYQIDEIQCKQGQTLIIRSVEGYLTCVTPDTGKILVERGWARYVVEKTVQ